MATMYVVWHKYPTKVIGGTTMQTEGSFISSQAVDITAGGTTTEAPAGAEYAAVWADVPYEFAPGLSPTAVKGSTSEPYPANQPVEVPNIIPFGTKIAGIAI